MQVNKNCNSFNKFDQFGKKIMSYTGTKPHKPIFSNIRKIGGGGRQAEDN